MSVTRRRPTPSLSRSFSADTAQRVPARNSPGRIDTLVGETAPAFEPTQSGRFRRPLVRLSGESSAA